MVELQPLGSGILLRVNFCSSDALSIYLGAIFHYTDAPDFPAASSLRVLILYIIQVDVSQFLLQGSCIS